MIGFQPMFEDFPFRLNPDVERIEVNEDFKQTTFRDSYSVFLLKLWYEKLAGNYDDIKINRWNVLSRKDFLTSKFDWADVIVLEHPFGYVDKLFQDRQFIYSSHNFEYGLAAQTGAGENYLKKLFIHEKEVVEDSRRIIAISESDKRNFVNRYGADEGKISVIPNGIENKDIDYQASERDFGFFIGSSHLPNVHAVNIILDAAEQLPEEDFVIAGSVCQSIEREVPANVKLEGYVSEEEKQELYSRAKFGLNPVLEGSGANIKMLEYFQHHLPVLATEKGVRGGFRDFSEIVEPDEIPEAIASKDENDWNQLSSISEEATENFKWEVMVNNLESSFMK